MPENWVVAKKIVSQLGFSLSWSLFFMRDLEQMSSPIFHNTLNVGLPSLCLQDRGWSTWKENMLNMCSRFYSNYLTCYSVPILRKSGIYSIQYDSDIEWPYLHNLKTICCPLLSELPAFLSQRLATTLCGVT